MERQPKFLTIPDLENSEVKEIYVLNNSKPKGTIVLNTDKTAIVIPNTWIPIRITDFAPKGDILNSIDFRNFITKGLLKAVDREWAEEILNTEDAQYEIKRIFQSTNIDNEIGRKTAEIQQEVKEQEIQRTEEVSLKVINILEAPEQSQMDKLNLLRNIKDELTKKDLKYIIFYAKEHNYPKIGKWAQKGLKALS